MFILNFFQPFVFKKSVFYCNVFCRFVFGFREWKYLFLCCLLKNANLHFLFWKHFCRLRHIRYLRIHLGLSIPLFSFRSQQGSWFWRITKKFPPKILSFFHLCCWCSKVFRKNSTSDFDPNWQLRSTARLGVEITVGIFIRNLRCGLLNFGIRQDETLRVARESKRDPSFSAK